MAEREIVYRVAVGALLAAGLGVSMGYRRRADRAGGGISRGRDGAVMSILLAASGLAGLAAFVLWFFRPGVIDFARLALPDWVRSAGLALAALMLPLFVWMFRHLAGNVTPTSAVRERATLVTTGPYRRIRHPMYVFGCLYYMGLSMAMGTWLLAAIVAAGFSLVAWRTQREEGNLEQRFGEEYRRYRARTGRFVPRLLRRGH